jgi:hypothetical protein
MLIWMMEPLMGRPDRQRARFEHSREQFVSR